MPKAFYVYIATNYPNKVLYVGVTGDIHRRMYEHKQKLVPGFTAKYNINKLVYAEAFPTALEAIAAEKRLKGWTRAKKLQLIKQVNPSFTDLSKV